MKTVTFKIARDFNDTIKIKSENKVIHKTSIRIELRLYQYEKTTT